VSTERGQLLTIARSGAATSALLALIVVLASGMVASRAGTTAPAAFRLELDGRHEAAADAPLGFWHVGTFTASGLFCSSGGATTLGVTGTSPADATAVRLLACADGSGSATALVVSVDREHGGAGEWRIVSGTGEHARLRGRGTFRSVRTGGDSSDHGSITFRSTWTGQADLDDAPPAVALARVSVTKLRRPVGSYALRLAFTAQDAPGNAVRYRVTVSARRAFLSSRLGRTESGAASATIRVRPALNVRRLRVEITASDPLGNERKLSREVALPK
jgi:hypothetical protein